MRNNQVKIILFLLFSVVFAFSINAQTPDPKKKQAEEPKAAEPDAASVSVDVTAAFVTDYVFRGISLHDNYYVQEGKAYESYKFTPAFQPSITVNSPLEGLSFNLWGSFAMTHRDDMDSDRRFQFGPDEADLLTTPNPLGLTDAVTGDPLPIPAVITAAGVDPNAPALIADIYNHTPQQVLVNGIASWYGGYNFQGGTPGYYKDANGLGRSDELDLTLDYSAETKLGNFSFGIVNYALVNKKSMGGDTFYHEVYFSYALPMLSDLTLKVFSDVQSNNMYSNLGYGSSYELSDDFSLDYAAGVGYGMRNSLEGVQDVTGSLGFTFKGISVSANVSHRPNMALIEASDPNTNLPVWLNGDSTAADGMVEDPSRNQGVVNSLINQVITDAMTQNGAVVSPFGGYAYVPRTKLPSNLYWLSVGYSTSF